MTAYTGRHGLPYPEPTNAAVIHKDIERLAKKVDIELSSVDVSDELAEAEQRIQGDVDNKLAPVVAGAQALQDSVQNLDGRVVAVEALAGLEPGGVSDATVASLVVQGGSLTRASLDDLYSGSGYMVDTARYGLVADGVTDDSAAVQAAIADSPEGATLVFPPGRPIRLVPAVQVDRPLKIAGGFFLTASGQAFNITSTGAHIDGVEIEGPGTVVPYAIRNHGIHAEGTLANPLQVKITNARIRGMRDSGIWLEHVKDFTLDGNDIDDFRYAGIWIASGKGGRISGNSVSDAVWNQTTECYGIALTGTDGRVENRSENIIVAMNKVSNVADMTGLDTHGGIGITFAFNQVLGCKTGITGTAGNTNRDTAPEQLVIVGNTIIGDPNSPWTTSGISIGGSPDDHPLDPLWADALAMSNVIRNVNQPINMPGTRGQKVDPNLSLIRHNTGDLPVPEYPQPTVIESGLKLDTDGIPYF